MLRSRPLFHLQIELHPTIDLGQTLAGGRRLFPVAGGRFEGDRLKGTVAPTIGSDLLLVRNDGSAQQDVRMLLVTDDGAPILMTYRGVRHGPPDVLARMAKGEAVDPADYYLRTAPFFETASDRYGWLNTIVSIGTGEKRADGSVRYDVFEVL